jgi:MFS family permease
VHPGQIPGGGVAASFSLWAWAPAVAITGVFLLLVYPDGRLPGRRWRWVMYVCLFAVIASVADVLVPGPMDVTGFPDHDNPFGVEALEPLLRPLEPVVLLIPLCSVAAVASLAVRFLLGDRTERLQIKWLAAAGGLCGGLYFVSLVAAALLADDHGNTPGWIEVVQDVWFVSLGLIPVAIGIAVLRYRLFEIDVIIRRTLIYATLVGVLALLYLGGAALVGALLRGVTGSSGTLAVTVSTLAVALAFQPLRHVIQRAVDRRFYRAGYDAQAAVDGFSERLREQIDLDALCGELRAVVSGTVQPTHASVWLRGDPGSDAQPR